MAPRSNEAFQAIKDARRADILMSALMIFARQGYAATRISRITQKAGISHGLFYHYFESKEAIFIELVRMAIEGSNLFVRAIASQDLPPAEKVQAMAAGVLESLRETDDTALFFLLVLQASVSEGVPEAASQIAKTQTIPIELLSGIAAEGQQNGSVRDGDPVQMTIAFWAAVQGLAIQHLVGEKAISVSPQLLTRIFLP